MKTKRWKILLLVMATVAVGALGSCQLLYEPFNQMTIDGTRYPLSRMYVYEHSDIDDVLTVVITSKGLDISGSQGETFSGTGDYLAITLASTTGSLEPGIYRFKAPDPPAIVPLFSYAGVGYDADLDQGEEGYLVGGGQIIVRSILGGGYSIEFDLEGGTVDELNSSDPPEQWVWPTSTTIAARFRGEAAQTFHGPFFGSNGP